MNCDYKIDSNIKANNHLNFFESIHLIAASIGFFYSFICSIRMIKCINEFLILKEVTNWELFWVCAGFSTLLYGIRIMFSNMNSVIVNHVIVQSEKKEEEKCQ